MCTAIALAYSELPLLLMDEHGLDARIHDRGGEKEIRFYWQARPPALPVWWDGALRIVKWGNRDRAERKLPPTGWTWRDTVEDGKWAALAPEPVFVPANFALMNGVWFKVKQGMQALLVHDRAGAPVVYMLCEPATRYYQVMTRSEWMPTLVGEVI
ncbi:MAG TPA: hypothetical protein VGE74_24000 [Gemmata sp.]